MTQTAQMLEVCQAVEKQHGMTFFLAPAWEPFPQETLGCEVTHSRRRYAPPHLWRVGQYEGATLLFVTVWAGIASVLSVPG